MKAPSFNDGVLITDIAVMAQATILGLALGESWYLSQAIGSAFNAYIQYTSKQDIAIYLCAIIGILVCVYFIMRGGIFDIQKLWSSKRVDIFILVVFGLCISAIVGGLGTVKYQKYVGMIDIPQLMLIVATPAVIALMLFFRAIMSQP